MKNKLSISALFLLLAGSMVAQNNVWLNIHHKLGNNDFAFQVGSTNNMGHEFNVTRLEYYLSEISIVHDGGSTTPIENIWLLVNAEEAVQVNLGNHNINTVEAIQFHIGVDPAHNHLDPSTYEASHPLAPQFPSMHWGWASGYRFIAVEGFGSSAFNQMYQLHGLGDGNYFTTVVPYPTSAANGAIQIDLDADYARVLENIPVNMGVIDHGEEREAKIAIENFRDFVFSPAGSVSASGDVAESYSLNIFPNPTQNGRTTVKVSGLSAKNVQFQVSDLQGKIVQTQVLQLGENAVEIQLQTSGVYLLHLMQNGRSIVTRELVVQP
ncbi:MAG TPA: T9SS type A sorting domain-containing protein [Saprospiraceae bacterium]|nr:T9SS type A sorting domain-containing protein [Saprospiraceae bacterium]HMQ85598.1 T9SS type A sorting domain-containing protein [Saprospiraceae bacterium]